MRKTDFIKEQVELLKNDISEQDIKDNIKRFVLQNQEHGNFEWIIDACMELCAEIYLETYRE